MTFQQLGIIPSILNALKKEAYTAPTPIQEQAIPPVLKKKDLLGCAQTGTGKTAAFAVPILQLLAEQGSVHPKKIRALVLTPTRELALQIQESFAAYGRFLPLKTCVIFGGVPQNPQVQQLKQGVDVLVATPGRLNDLIGQGFIKLKDVQIFVLDEADRMLDMGFIHDVKKVIEQLPKKRQTLLFSATMPQEIADLADSMLHKPAHISIVPAATPVELIQQGVYLVEKKAKRDLLRAVLEERSLPQTLVFTRTKHGADRVARDLSRAGIPAKSIHGDKSQSARQNALKQFKDYKIPVLVATDIAARGIDISELPLVINYDLPNVPETYVHRIGRTGRAGQEGTALSFCDPSELPYLKDIEALTRVAIPALEPPAGTPLAEAQTAARYVRHDPTLPPEPAKTEKQAGARRGKKKQEKAAKPEKQTGKTVKDGGKKGQSQRKKVVTAEKAAREPAPARTATKKGRGKHSGARTSVRPIEPAYQSITVRVSSKGGSNRRSRRDESEGRVDIMTPRSGRPLAPSTAARIRAKVEAKLAERRAAQASGSSAQSRTKKQGKVQRKPQTRSGRGRARG